MEEQNAQNVGKIRELLQRKDVAERVLENIQKGRKEARVTIGRAARLFDLRETKLREWERQYRLLTPARSKDTDTPDERQTGQRQYSLEELDKLAIIITLIDEGFSPGEIPQNVDELWRAIASVEEQLEDDLYIDQYVQDIYEKELFWRYFVPHVLQMSLLLLCEDSPDLAAGIVLPLRNEGVYPVPKVVDDVRRVGESLIGWRGESSTFYTFLTPAPAFQYAGVYRVEMLPLVENSEFSKDIYIVIERKAKSLSFDENRVEIVRRLLALVCENIPTWRAYFSRGVRDSTYHASNFNSTTSPDDDVLNGLADMVVRLGEKHGQASKWAFCGIMRPDDTSLPIRQRKLIIQAESKNAPYKKARTITLSPEKFPDSPSLRAYQGGHVVYRPWVSKADLTIAHREIEGPIRSALAVPIGGEHDAPLGVFYVASYEERAFSEDDQRVLRVMGKIMEELLLTYQMRLSVKSDLGNILTHPDIVDRTFEDFFSENDFVQEIDGLLTAIQKEQVTNGVVSIIAVDIDRQSSRAITYGDRLTRNLSRKIGTEIEKRLSTQFPNHDNWKLFHIFADRYYILLKDISLEEAGQKAERLRQMLKGSYQIDALRAPTDALGVRSGLQLVPDVSVRLGVTSYTYEKLKEVLERYPEEAAVGEMQAVMTFWLDKALEEARIAGGDGVVMWDKGSRGFVPRASVETNLA